jgi:pectate disaccharide-lyase
MRKGTLIGLSIICVMSLVIWFSCDPFNSEEKSNNNLTDYNVLNGTDTVRASEAVLYVAPAGVSGAAGDINNPTTLQDAITRLASGGQIWVRGGTYNYTSPIKTGRTNSGTSGSNNKITNYASESPVLDFGGMSFADANRGLSIEGNYWYVKGLKIQKAGDNGIIVMGNNNTIENCKLYANRDSGLQIARYLSSIPSSEWPANNIVKGCESWDNLDTDNGEDADGFSCKLSVSTGNQFQNCYSHHNSDDGWDLYTYSDYDAIGPVKITSCTAAYNGTTSTGQSGSGSDGNGFKLGGEDVSIKHTVISCVSTNNKKDGFTANSNPGPIYLSGCTASGNGGTAFKDVANQ